MPENTTQSEGEWQTRKRRIDPRLDACGWRLRKGAVAELGGARRTEEEETDNGPADYALWLDGHIAGIVEAKKLALGPQNVLTGIYAKYFTETELQELLSFYRTPLGRKAAGLSAVMTVEMGAAGQALGGSPELHRRLDEELRRVFPGR